MRRGKIPKFAIANGNYVGQLPSELHNLSVASRSLLRPVQSYGRLAAFFNNGGSRLTGHVHSNKLNTALIRSKLPLAPSDVPVRVLITSPFASNSSTIVRALLARVKEDYLFQRDKISGVLAFFRNVRNLIMLKIDIDHNILKILSDGEVSNDMVYVDKAKTPENEEGMLEDFIESEKNKRDYRRLYRRSFTL